MRKLKLQMQMTIDGYVAGPNGEMDWMTFSSEDKLAEYANALIDTSDTILMGRKMTDGFVDYWTKESENPESPQYSFAQKWSIYPKSFLAKPSRNRDGQIRLWQTAIWSKKSKK